MLKIGEQVLGRYRVIDLLPEGGQAFLAKGLDEAKGSTVVIRQLNVAADHPRYPIERARFERAARLRIDHPNVVDPIDAGEADGNCYMILPFIDGRTLEELLMREGGKLTPDRATKIIRQIAEALAACHDRGITHRDIKPENILVDSGDHAYLIDFGISSLASEPTITQGSGFLGSLPWAPPEQIFNPRERDYRMDQYSLGAVLYFLLTGEMVTKGNNPEQVMQYTCNVVPSSPHELDSGIPRHISDVCMQLLAKKTNDRFHKMGAFIQALEGNGSSIPVAQACPSCGERSGAAAHFCIRCGADLTLATTGTATTTCCMACGASVENKAACPKCQRTFSPSDHRIEFTSGALTGWIFRIPMDLFVTGRESLAPRDFHISRQHLRVACMNGEVMIEDVGSANKTYIDGRTFAQPLMLTPNCQIVIAGNTGIYRKK